MNSVHKLSGLAIVLAILMVVTVSFVGRSQKTAPSIISLAWPPQVVAGAPPERTLSVDFVDPDGDVVWVTVDVRYPDGSPPGHGEFDARVPGRTQGRINAPLSCTQVGRVQARVILKDQAGNRSAPPWEFSFECVSGGTPPPPPPPPPGGLQVSVYCPSSVVVSLLCSASLLESVPSNADLVWEWKLDGVVIYTGSPDLSYDPSKLAAGSHTVTVTVTDRVNNRTGSASTTFTKPASTPPPGGRDQLLADGEETTTIELPLSGTVRVTVKCANLLSEIALMAVMVDVEGKPTPEYRNLMLLYYSIADFCIKQQQQQPSAAVSSSANAGLALLDLRLPAGRVRFKAQHNLLLLGILTETTTVRSEGINDFSVGYDPDTGTSVVAVHSGTVRIEPTNSNLPPTTLVAGQQVEVTQSGVGPVTAIGGTPGTQPPPSGGSSLKSFDVNNNDLIDNEEFFAIIDYWMAGLIDNATFFKAIDLWIFQKPISSAQVNPKRLKLDSVTLASDSARHTLTFVASGQGITSMGVEVFNLNGQRVFAQTVAGRRLRWDIRNEHGQPLANGVYLYAITVQGGNGETMTSEVKKLIILR